MVCIYKNMQMLLNIWIYASELKLMCCRSNILIADLMTDVTKQKCVPLIYGVIYVRKAIIKVFKKINYIRKELSKFCVSLSKNDTHLYWSYHTIVTIIVLINCHHCASSRLIVTDVLTNDDRYII